MKKYIATTLIVFLAFTTQACAQEDLSKEKKKIEKVIDTYKKALNTSDVKLAHSLYTDDGVLMPYNGPTAAGSEGLLKSYEYVFSQIKLSLEFEIKEISVSDNLAFAITNSKGTLTFVASGDSIPEKNRELFTFKKINGEWKIASYMFNKAEAPTAPK